MNKSSITILCTIIFNVNRITSLASFALFAVQAESKFTNKNDILQSRDIISDTISPEIHNILDYLLKSLSSVVNFITTSISSTLFRQNTSAGIKVDAKDIPVLDFQKTIIIEGKNGNITINPGITYFNDEALKNGKVRVQIIDGNFYVNDNLVAKKDTDTEAVAPGAYSMHDFNYSGVSSFTLELKPDEFMDYVDSTGAKKHVNYITKMNFT